MIGYLKGRVVERGEESVIVDVGGVGYEVNCSLNTLDQIFDRDEAELWIQTHLREDALTLFGFATKVEKNMFLSLVKVNGVGPKMAIKILSGASIDQLANMIEAGDVKALSNLPKVGKKTAEQLVLSLKGKLVMSDEAPAVKRTVGAAAPVGPRSELVSALVNLGFRPQDVEKVVEGMPYDIDLQNGIRQGLRALTGQF